MKAKIMFAFLIVFALAAVAIAQTKISLTGQCAKPDEQHSIQVGDRPNHSFAISQGKCTYTKSYELAGIEGRGGVITTFSETSGNTSRLRIFYVDTMANGDKVNVREEGTLTLKDGVPQSGETRWRCVGATGKLKSVKEKGTCKLTSAVADGSATWECEGEYELPK